MSNRTKRYVRIFRLRTPYLMITLTLAPETVTNLLKEKDPQRTFHCPNL